MKKIIISLLLVFSFSTFIYADRCIRGNCRNGQGVIEYDSGAVYEGQCTNGLAHGKGVLYDHGNIFKGTFYKGFAHGRFKVFYPEYGWCTEVFRYGYAVRK